MTPLDPKEFFLAVEPDEKGLAYIGETRVRFADLLGHLNEFIPPSPERDAMVQHLFEACVWANRATALQYRKG